MSGHPASDGPNPWSWPPARCDSDPDPWYLAWQSIQLVDEDPDNY